MKYASVCSGVEAASLAWMPLGWEAAWFSEIEPFPCAVLKERFPNVPNLGDMTKIEVENLENGDQRFTGGDGTTCLVSGGVDLLVGGTPCQSFSVAGKREGLGGASGLAKHFVRLLREMRPRWFVWENVPGSLSSRTNGQFDFNFLVSEYAKCGYSCGWRVLDAQYVRVDGYPRAVPQRRRRVFVVGHSSADWRYPASVLFEPDSLFGDTPPRRVKGKGFTGNLADGVGEAGRLWDAFNQGKNAKFGAAGFDGSMGEKAGNIGYEEEVSPVLKAGGRGADVVSYANHQFGGFAPDEIAPTIKASPSGGTLHCMHDHAAVLAVAQNQLGEVRTGDVAGTLEARHDSSPCADRMPDKGKLNCVICTNGAGHDSGDVTPTLQANLGKLLSNQTPIVCYENHAQDSRIKDAGEVSPQLNATAGTGGNNLPLVQTFTKTAHPQNPEQGQGFAETDAAKTLSAHTSPASEIRAEELVAVAIAENTIGRKPHNGGNGTGAQEELAYTQNATGVMGVAMNTLVRRLMPIETERLMGFPEVDILEIGKMTKDEFIAWELASGNIKVDFFTGKVFSCRTGGGTPCPPHELEGTILSGYKVVSLREKGVKKQCRVHRIMWIAAHGIIPDGYVIDHINNDKLDNRLCNLQLLTPEENSTKAAKDGLYLTGEDHPKTKLTDEQKNDIITLYETEYYSVRRLAAMYGVSKSRIHQLVKRQGWTQIPWRGKPAEECPDSVRYKACGNSMCVNVMRWIGMRIELVERKMK